MMQRSKIAHVITGLGKGGAEGVLYRILSYENQFEHIVINLGKEDFYSKEIKNLNIKVFNLNLKNFIFFPFSLLNLFLIIKREKPDLIHTWMYHADLIGGIIGRLGGCKEIIWCVRNSNIDKKFTPGLTRVVIKFCSLISNFIPSKIVYCSKNSARLHEKMGYPASKSVIIHNGVNYNFFKPINNIKKNILRILKISPEKFILGLVSRWNPQKDLENFISTMGNLKSENFYNWHLIMVGENIDINNGRLTKILKKNKIFENTTLLGFKKNLISIYNSMDINLLTSAYGEAFPNVVVEAMSCEIPCIVTDVGDSKSIVENTGWVTEPKNKEKMKTTIKQAFREFQNKENWMLRKKNSRKKIIEIFSMENMIKNYQKIWKTLL